MGKKVNTKENSRIKYLASHIVKYSAATIAGEKPATLMAISNHFDKFFDFWEEFKNDVFYNGYVKYCELKRKNMVASVLFYYKPKMEELLKEEEIKQFLSGQGYKTDFLEDVLDLLKNKYRSFQSPQMFPHEIGVFLGIPLKDVKGFMSLSSLPRAKITGTRWVIYGNPEPSLEVMGKHKKAEKRIRGLLFSKDPIDMLNGKY